MIFLTRVGTLVCPPPKLPFFRWSSFMYTVPSFQAGIRRPRYTTTTCQAYETMLAGLGRFRLKCNTPFVWPFWPTGLLFFLFFHRFCLFSMILCVPQVLGSATSKYLRAKETSSRAVKNRAKRFAVGGWSSTIQRPQTTLQLKLHIWSSSLVSAHFLSSVDDISKLSFLLAKPVENFPLDCNFTSKGACGWRNTKETPILVTYNISRFWQFSSSKCPDGRLEESFVWREGSYVWVGNVGCACRVLVSQGDLSTWTFSGNWLKPKEIKRRWRKTKPACGTWVHWWRQIWPTSMRMLRAAALHSNPSSNLWNSWTLRLCHGFSHR